MLSPEKSIVDLLTQSKATEALHPQDYLMIKEILMTNEAHGDAP